MGEEFARASRTLHTDPRQVASFPDIESLKAYVEEHPLAGKTILIKGSNGNHMQQAVKAL